jgi:hypothetical protein
LCKLGACKLKSYYLLYIFSQRILVEGGVRDLQVLPELHSLALDHVPLNPEIRIPDNSFLVQSPFLLWTLIEY